jgi:hypothetical protein
MMATLDPIVITEMISASIHIIFLDYTLSTRIKQNGIDISILSYNRIHTFHSDKYT